MQNVLELVCYLHTMKLDDVVKADEVAFCWLF